MLQEGSFTCVPMTIASGIDIVEIEKIRELIEKRGAKFLARVFTGGELDYCNRQVDKYQHFAARFAAKEAVMKALGSGWTGGVQWRHIEIRNNEKGAPSVVLHKKALALFTGSGFTQTSVSLSHCRAYAVASVTFIGQSPGPANG